MEFVLTRSAPNGNRNIGILRYVKIDGSLALGTAETEKCVTLGLSANETQVASEQLTSRKKKLTGPSYSE